MEADEEKTMKGIGNYSFGNTNYITDDIVDNIGFDMEYTKDQHCYVEISSIIEQNSLPKRVLTEGEYTEICNYVKTYAGLTIDCELDLLVKYPDMHPLTIQSIVEEVSITKYSNFGEDNAQRLDTYLKRFKEMTADNERTDALLQIALEENLQPMALCRELLKLIFKSKSKCYITQLLRYPNLLENLKLRSNIIRCSISDNNFGPYIDLKRQLIGVEYEAKLQKMAESAGLHFHTEVKLRALGYDKTPDLKMIVPFLYKGKIINWMESKARFGSISIHRRCIKEQYSSYCNRYGAGIVIYWFGYHKQILEMKDINIDIIILTNFPHKTDITNFELTNPT